jgi:hypothetical protein
MAWNFKSNHKSEEATAKRSVSDSFPPSLQDTPGPIGENAKTWY